MQPEYYYSVPTCVMSGLLYNRFCDLSQVEITAVNDFLTICNQYVKDNSGRKYEITYSEVPYCYDDFYSSPFDKIARYGENIDITVTVI